MGRIHSHRKGKSHSKRPVSKLPPTWVTYTPEEVENIIVKLGKEGLTPARIGIRLRDEYGILLVEQILNMGIVDVLKKHGLEPRLPPDLESLLKRAQRMREHLDKHKKDYRNVRSLELVEAKIHRLAKYYKSKGLLPSDWKFTTKVARLE